MPPINLYSSHPADTAMLGFMDALSMNLAREVVLLPLSALPAPDRQRRQALRVEREEIREDLLRLRTALDAYCLGRRASDVGRENGLVFDIDALSTRLRVVEAILGQKGGPDNG